MTDAGAPAVRRVVLTGSECTGKTTLAQELAERLGTEWVPEFVREYAARTAARGAALGFADHGPIARGQMAAEDAAVARASERGAALVVLDTDLVSTAVYCEHYFGRCPEWIAETARTRAGALYLLCAPDLPWLPDGIRDRGDRRAEMHALFRDQLERWALPFVEVTGAGTARLDAALGAIHARLGVAR